MDGGVDMEQLEQVLKDNAHNCLKVGTFSAASNITGVLSDTTAISIMLHKHNALAFFDFAAAGPYIPLEMNPHVPGPEGSLAYKDAIFLSPHKMVGGVATPGVLVVKRSIAKRFCSGVPPTQPGGGTVRYVFESDHLYVDSLEEREEGGTPDIVGAVRCALAFRLKAAVGPARIAACEASHWALLRGLLEAHPGVRILGNTACPRLAIASLVIRHGARYLHHNFVAALLNDLFGIQARAGCACAGPYAFGLLGMHGEAGAALRSALRQGDELSKPGFVRLGAAYFMSAAAVRFLAAALVFVAEHGWRLLPLYAARPRSVEWRHRAAPAEPDQRPGLAGLCFGAPPPPPPPCMEGGAAADEAAWATYLSAALAAAEAAARAAAEDEGLAARLAAEETAGEGWLTSAEGRRLRWFLLPSEAAARLRAGGASAPPPPLPPPGHTAFYADDDAVGGRDAEDELSAAKRGQCGRRGAGAAGRRGKAVRRRWQRAMGRGGGH